MEGRGEYLNSTNASTTNVNVGTGRRTPRRNGPSLADISSPTPRSRSTSSRSTSRPIVPPEPHAHDFWIKLGLLCLKALKYAVIFGFVVTGTIFLAYALYNAYCSCHPIKYINIFFISTGLFLCILPIVALVSYLVGFSLENFYAAGRIPQAAGYSNNNNTRQGEGSWETLWSPAPMAVEPCKPSGRCPPTECPYCKPLGLKSTIPPAGLHGQCQCGTKAIPEMPKCEENWDCCENIEQNCEQDEDWFNRQIKTGPLIPSDFPSCQAERMRINALRCAAVTVRPPVSPVDNGRCVRRLCAASPEQQSQNQNPTTCTRDRQRAVAREQPTVFQQQQKTCCKQQPTTCRKHSTCRLRPHPRPQAKQLSPHTCPSGGTMRRNSNSPEGHGHGRHSSNSNVEEGHPRVLPQPGCYGLNPPTRPPEFAFFRADDY